MSNFIPISELKDQISLSFFLAKLGYQPTSGSTGKEKKYLSMLRDSDTDPSFTVDDEKGLWFDHGLRQGGDLIDLAMRYWPRLEFKEVLVKITEISGRSAMAPVSDQFRPQKRPRIKAFSIPNYKITDIKALGTNQVITDYLLRRGVWGIANEKMREVYYYVEDEKKQRKHYFAVGWQNQNGSWEIRNKYFKGSLGKKAITVIEGDPLKLALFEGYMNYLSWVRFNPEAFHTAIVLNSLINLPAALAFARDFRQIDLYFDQDATGRAATHEFTLALPFSKDKSNVYKGHNDFNERLMHELKSFGLLPGQSV